MLTNEVGLHGPRGTAVQMRTRHGDVEPDRAMRGPGGTAEGRVAGLPRAGCSGTAVRGAPRCAETPTTRAPAATGGTRFAQKYRWYQAQAMQISSRTHLTELRCGSRR